MHDLQYANATQPPRPGPPLSAEVDEIERAASILRSHPGYAAPDALVARIRALIDSGRYRMFDA